LWLIPLFRMGWRLNGALRKADIVYDQIFGLIGAVWMDFTLSG